MKCLVNPHSSFWETMLRACILSTPLCLSFWVLYYTVTELCTIFLIFNAFLLIKLRDLDGLELFEIDSFLPHQWQKLVSFCDQNISYGSRLQKSQTLCENMNIHCISNFIQMVVMKSGWHMAWNLPRETCDYHFQLFDNGTVTTVPMLRSLVWCWRIESRPSGCKTSLRLPLLPNVWFLSQHVSYKCYI